MWHGQTQNQSSNDVPHEAQPINGSKRKKNCISGNVLFEAAVLLTFGLAG